MRDGYAPDKAEAFFEKLSRRLKALGPVRSIALAAQGPFATEDDDARHQLTAEGPAESSRVQQSMVEETVGAGYFATLSEPMLAGREFEEPDQWRQTGGSKALPVVLNETAARRLFANADAIGKRARDDKQFYEVVGLVRDLKTGIGISQSVVYLPLTARDFARPPAGGITILAHSSLACTASSIRFTSKTWRSELFAVSSSSR